MGAAVLPYIDLSSRSEQSRQRRGKHVGFILCLLPYGRVQGIPPLQQELIQAIVVGLKCLPRCLLSDGTSPTHSPEFLQKGVDGIERVFGRLDRRAPHPGDSNASGDEHFFLSFVVQLERLELPTH